MGNFIIRKKKCLSKVHHGGAYSGKGTVDNMADMIHFANQLKKHFPEFKPQDINAMIWYQHYKRMLLSLETGGIFDVKKYLAKVLQLNPVLIINKRKPLLAVLLNRVFYKKHKLFISK